MMNSKRFIMTALVLCCTIARAGAGTPDSSAFYLTKLVSALRQMKDVSYAYDMNVKFPNGDKDELSGVMSMDGEAGVYFNECGAFTMLYDHHWFYKADHKNRTVTVVDLDRGQDTRLRKETEKYFLQNGAVNSFLDSVMMKTAVVRKVVRKGELTEMSIGFPAKGSVRSVEVVLSNAVALPVRYSMVVQYPWQRTPKGTQVVEAAIKCRDFSRPGKQQHRESAYFSSHKGKIELKKYPNYQLFTKL